MEVNDISKVEEVFAFGKYIYFCPYCHEIIDKKDSDTNCNFCKHEIDWELDDETN